MSLTIDICDLQEFIDLFLRQVVLRYEFKLDGGYVSAVFSVEYLEDLNDVLSQRLGIYFLEHVQQKLLKVYRAVSVLVHCF